MYRKRENKILGKNIVHYNKLDSTQKEILRQIEKNEIENGTIIIADIQTDGIGTHGRSWYTTEENNIAFSFVLYLDTKIENLKNLTIEIAEIFVKIFKDLYNIKIQIKDPNDLVIDDKKVGGILTQTKLQGDNVKNLVVGIGINTNQTKFPKEIKDIATSIKKKFFISIDNQKVIEEFCNIFEEKIIKMLGEKK